MSSQSKTPNLQLNQWAASDPVVRTDFNADNVRIDAAVGGIKIPVVKLMEVTTALNAASVELNFAGVDLSEYRGMDIIINACGVQLGTNTNAYYYDYLYTRVNKDAANGHYYYSSDASTLATAAVPRNIDAQHPPVLIQMMHIGWCDTGSGNDILFAQGYSVVKCAGADTSGSVGTSTPIVYKNLRDIANLCTVDFLIVSNTSGEVPMIQAGAKFTVYGIRK